MTQLRALYRRRQENQCEKIMKLRDRCEDGTKAILGSRMK